MLVYVPEALLAAPDIGPALCLAAVTDEGWVLQYVPKALRTAELCLAAVTEYGGALAYVPEALREQVEKAARLGILPKNC
jgi:hypothetical protein